MSGPAATTAPEAVVTGIGVVAPTGIGVEEHWNAVLAGKSGIGRIRRFDPTSYPTRLAGEVSGFATEELVPARLTPATDRWTHLAIAAADQALADARIDPSQLGEYDMAVVTASSSGGTDFGQHEMDRLYNKGPGWVSAYQSIAWFYAATTGQLSIRHGMRGPCGVLCSEQAGGLDALGQARRLLRTESSLVVSGGTDASLCPYGLTAQLATGKLSTVDDPARAYLPFDVDATGYVPGEGGAILIVERADSATGRGFDRRWGTIVGYAAGFDPPPGSSRPPALRATIERALDDAGLDRSDIDVVFADAIGVPAEDAIEAAAISAVFGPRRVPVTAPKTLTGRLYGGAALDVATALLALRDQVVPHTVGPTRLAADIDIDLVLDEPRERPLSTALVLARGEGGFTSALVLRR
ncbi:MAG: ketosynthase chain-length factor [Pseudonocardia sp.]|nr:ketosynthase chain-length factor [Pseudonocardia sp.]